MDDKAAEIAVWLSGRTLPGVEPERAAPDLARMAKMRPAQAWSSVTSGKPRLFKLCASDTEARALAERLADIGVETHICSGQDSPPVPPDDGGDNTAKLYGCSGGCACLVLAAVAFIELIANGPNPGQKSAVPTAIAWLVLALGLVYFMVNVAKKPHGAAAAFGFCLMALLVVLYFLWLG